MRIKLFGPVSSSGRKSLKYKLFPIPSLTMPTIAAYTPERHEISLHNIYDVVDDGKIIRPELLSDADIIAVSSMTPQIRDANSIINFSKSKGMYTAHGGAHVTVRPKDSTADTVFIGESENTWPLFLEDFENGQPLSEYKFVSNRPREISLKTPRRDLQPRKGISRLINYTASIEYSRGCPYSCDFCSVPTLGKGYSTRPIAELIAEIEQIPQKNIFFTSNNFAGDPKRTKQFLKELAPLNKEWIAGVTPESIVEDPELVDLIKKSGGRGLFLGFESLSDSYLKSLHNPKKKVGSYEKVIRSLQDAGIVSEIGFIFGTDVDDISCFDNFYNFIMKNKVPLVSVNIATPLPGTPLYDQMALENRIIDSDFRHYNFDTVVFRPKNMTPEQLQNGYDAFYDIVNTLSATAERLWARSTVSYPWVVVPSLINLVNHGKRQPGNYKI